MLRLKIFILIFLYCAVNIFLHAQQSEVPTDFIKISTDLTLKNTQIIPTLT